MTKKFNYLLNRRMVQPAKLLRAPRTVWGGFDGVKSNLSIALLSIFLVFASAAPVCSANGSAGPNGNWWQTVEQGGLEQVGKAYGGGEPIGVREIVANVIKIVLGFLGILAVVLILWAGFKWLTAGGNEENVAAAKKILIAGVIGLVIILSAYILANFVINQLYGATTGVPAGN